MKKNNEKQEILNELKAGKYNFGCSFCSKNFVDKKIVDLGKHLKINHPKEWDKIEQETWKNILTKGNYPLSKVKHLSSKWKKS